jgi:hypothetical protein
VETVAETAINDHWQRYLIVRERPFVARGKLAYIDEAFGSGINLD